jgi:2-octaprenyl-6-methoxyphenol hydroxylase
VVWTARTDQVARILDYSDEAFIERLQQRFGDWLGRLGAPGARRAYPLKLIQVRHPVQRRALVIGNAAHTIHPVAGQGFNLGLRDVAVLADVLAEAGRSDNRDVGRDGILRTYETRRRRDTRRTTRFTDGLIRVFANDLLPFVVGRNIALTTLNHLPPAKRFLVRRTMGLSGSLPRLLRGRDPAD